MENPDDVKRQLLAARRKAAILEQQIAFGLAKPTAKTALDELQQEIARLEGKNGTPGNGAEPANPTRMQRMERNIQDTQKVLDDFRRTLVIEHDPEKRAKLEVSLRDLEKYLKGLIAEYIKAGGDPGNYTV